MKPSRQQGPSTLCVQKWQPKIRPDRRWLPGWEKIDLSRQRCMISDPLCGRKWPQKGRSDPYADGTGKKRSVHKCQNLAILHKAPNSTWVLYIRWTFCLLELIWMVRDSIWYKFLTFHVQVNSMNFWEMYQMLGPRVVSKQFGTNISMIILIVLLGKPIQFCPYIIPSYTLSIDGGSLDHPLNSWAI